MRTSIRTNRVWAECAQAECAQAGRVQTERAQTERAQSTVEYAILLLGAAAIAMLVVGWVAGTDVIGRLFDTVLGRIISQT